MPLQATSGAASYDGYGGGVPFEPIYIEQIFATHLYTGNGSTLAINNGIDLAGKGGLVWFKERVNASNHVLLDTLRGGDQRLQSNTTAAQATIANAITSFNSNGFTLGASGATNAVDSYVSWTFREQPKFFDVVTYTGNGVAGRQIAHNLGSVPGCIIVKQTGGGSTGGVNNWFVYHRSLGGTKYLGLDGTFAAITSSSTWNNTDPTSTVFTIGGTSDCNDNNGTYVAYLFAHDAGGFGLTGSDNVISCGSFTTDGSGIIPTVNLGYEPQWILAKPSSGTGNWFIMDNMRGWYNQQADQGNALFPNTSGAEAVGYNAMIPTATGFTGPNVNFGAGVTYIYIAIRRGPMKTPTSGTSVFAPTTTVNSAFPRFTSGFPVDWGFRRQNRNGSTIYIVGSRLLGDNYLDTASTSAEASGGGAVKFDSNTGWYNAASSTPPTVSWMWGRAPGFFDVVCYTGTGANTVVNHNLGVAPELMFVKHRSGLGIAGGWATYSATYGPVYRGFLNTTAAFTAGSQASYWGNGTTTVAPTATQITLGGATEVSDSGANYVAYLFASCPGVSKVGSYTGTGTTLQVNCGFTAGARFVMIKRIDSTGDWYVWDSTRGIVAGNDPYLLLNSTAAEVTGTDYVDTLNAGFEISSTAPAAINANGGTFIFLAIA